MKQFFFLSAFLFAVPAFLNAQWNVHAEAGISSNVRTKVFGESYAGVVYFADSRLTELHVEYRNERGLLISMSGGYQEEAFAFGERTSTFALVYPGLIIKKSYQYFPLKFAAGYHYEFNDSGFGIMAKAGFSLAYTHSHDVDSEFVWDRETWVGTSEESYLTTAHTRLVVDDRTKNNFRPQASLTLGGEYHFEKLFAGIYVEGRSWMTPTDEIFYHTEHSDSYKNFSRVQDGRISLLSSYIGWKVVLGWCFGKEKRR
jgi:hypothetical protein